MTLIKQIETDRISENQLNLLAASKSVYDLELVKDHQCSIDIIIRFVKPIFQKSL